MPPVPHAELFPLKKIARMIGLPPQKAIDILKSKGIEVESSGEIFKEIAEKNNTTPARIYEILLKTSKTVKTNKVEKARFQPASGMER